MDRSTFTFLAMIRTMLVISTMLVGVLTTIHIVEDGVATPAIAASDGSQITGFVKRSNGAGLVLFVSLQRS